MSGTIRPALRQYRTWGVDSTRWEGYRPRRGDIVVCTYPKCGTTWMQRIVGLLLTGSPDPVALADTSPWIEARFRGSIEQVLARLEAQSGRRILKTHLPLDGLPFCDDVQYIHVARDGRDVALSFHNHCLSYSPEVLAKFDAIGLNDPMLRRTMPRAAPDFPIFFRTWLTQGVTAEEPDGSPGLSFFGFQRTCWQERWRSNVLFVHYHDLSNNLGAEMRRIAAFLEVSVTDTAWPELVEAATFASMRRDGGKLMPRAAETFVGGASTFFHRGTSGRWQSLLGHSDLALYEQKVKARLPPACAAWLERGRLGTCDPRDAPD